jgi:molybdate transport system substrate-binding protein
LALALPLELGCRRTDPSPLVIFAASSLTESLTEVASKYAETSKQPTPALSFAASSMLARQIEEGAPADVFVSADAQWMDTLAQANLLASDTRIDLLGNTLVVIVPQDTTTLPQSLADLSRAEIKRLALAGEEVPAGRYADAALAEAGQAEGVRSKIVRGENVRQVLAWVAKGEADAGFVYATDAKVEPKVRVAFTVPAKLHPPIVYPAAVLAHAAHAEQAREFLAFTGSSEAAALFENAGFVVRESTP